MNTHSAHLDTQLAPRQHGGSDALGQARWDFSSNANACGPCPVALQAVQQANPQHYPDPSYTHLRAALADFHGVSAARVLLATSASECIQRLTAWRWRAGVRQVWTPAHAYGDYAHAARVWGMQTLCGLDLNLNHSTTTSSQGSGLLAWLCEPSSPLGQSESAQTVQTLLERENTHLVLDCAYAPLRLRGHSVLGAFNIGCPHPSSHSHALQRVWQLWSPNKALGLTGVRAAYAIAPLGAESDVLSLNTLAGSWPIGAHGQAMLLAWTTNEAQHWLAQSRHTLTQWDAALRQTLQEHGWVCSPSDTPYGCARPPVAINAHALRQHGIKCRDASSFGLPGAWRLSAQAPEALAALAAALKTTNKPNQGGPA